MNLEYLQDSHTFHVERIMDFLSHNLPLCAIHQTRTIIFFCYLFACLIEFLLYPPYSVGNTPFTLSTLLIPIIIVVCLHLILSVCYVFGALFERASCTTGLALIYFFHMMIPLVFLIGYIIISTLDYSTEKVCFSLSIIFTIAFFSDFLCGILSRRSQVVPLTFEIIGIVPSCILASLYFSNHIKRVYVPFLPLFIYFGLYFFALLCLSPCCGIFRRCTLTLLSDPEIGIEFDAAVDPQLKPFKTRTDWVDEPDAIGSDHGFGTLGSGGNLGFNTGGNNSSFSLSIPSQGGIGTPGATISSSGTAGGNGTIGGSGRRETRSRYQTRIQEGDQITRFPSRADFQLYNVETAPKHPLYLASPLPMLCTAILVSILMVHCIQPLINFYLWLAAAVVLLVLAVLLNSRAIACSFLAFTNLDDRNVDILWDHPSLSIL